MLLKLAEFTGDGRYVDAAERALRMIRPLLAQAPTGFARWLSGLDFALGEPKEIAIVGESGADELLDLVFEKYRPNQVVAIRRYPEYSIAGRAFSARRARHRLRLQEFRMRVAGHGARGAEG